MGESVVDECVRAVGSGLGARREGSVCWLGCRRRREGRKGGPKAIQANGRNRPASGREMRGIRVD